MRTIIRLVIFWAVSLPLFYLFGLPFLLEKLSAKAQGDAYAQCMQHMETEFHLGTAAAPFAQADGERYCHCVSDGVQFTQDDLPELLQKKTPARIVALQKTASATCNAQLQGVINDRLSQAPAPRIERDAEGNEIVHIQ